MELAEQLDPEEWHAHPRSLLRDPHRRRAPLRGHDRTSTPATASWRSSARRSRTRTTPSAPVRRAGSARELRALAEERAARAAGSSFAVRMGLNSGEVVVGRDRRRPAHGLHRAGARRRACGPGAAPGPSRWRHGDRADRAPRGGLLRLPRPWRTGFPRLERSRARVRAAGSGPDPKPPRELSRARLLTLRRPGPRAASTRDGSAAGAVGTTDGGPGHRGAGRGKEPPLSRARRARPRRGRSPCPRAVPRPHAPLSRHDRAGAQPLRRREERVTLRRPGRGAMRSRQRAARPDGPGSLARPARGVRSRPRRRDSIPKRAARVFFGPSSS